MSARIVRRAIRYLKARTPIPLWYHVHLGREDVVDDGVRRLPFAHLCGKLRIP